MRCTLSVGPITPLCCAGAPSLPEQITTNYIHTVCVQHVYNHRPSEQARKRDVISRRAVVVSSCRRIAACVTCVVNVHSNFLCAHDAHAHAGEQRAVIHLKQIIFITTTGGRLIATQAGVCVCVLKTRDDQLNSD